MQCDLTISHDCKTPICQLRYSKDLQTHSKSNFSIYLKCKVVSQTMNSVRSKSVSYQVEIINWKVRYVVINKFFKDFFTSSKHYFL